MSESTAPSKERVSPVVVAIESAIAALILLFVYVVVPALVAPGLWNSTIEVESGPLAGQVIATLVWILGLLVVVWWVDLIFPVSRGGGAGSKAAHVVTTAFLLFGISAYPTVCLIAALEDKGPTQGTFAVAIQLASFLVGMIFLTSGMVVRALRSISAGTR
jgi:hypothetical protein